MPLTLYVKYTGFYVLNKASAYRIAIGQIEKYARVGVLEASNKQQVPQEWNMLTGNFYFTKGSESPGFSSGLAN